MPNLHELAVLDAPFDDRLHRPFVRRGVFDGLVAHLPRLTRLAIGPCAVSDLSGVLGALAQLVELRVVQGAAWAATTIGPGEVYKLLVGAVALRRVALSPSIWRAWAGADQAAILEAAEARSIKLELT